MSRFFDEMVFPDTRRPEDALRWLGERMSYHTNVIRMALQMFEAVPDNPRVSTMVSRLVEPGALVSAAVYDRTSDDARQWLSAKGYEVRAERRIERDEMSAHIAAGLLRNPPPGPVELLLGPNDRVVAIVPGREAPGTPGPATPTPGPGASTAPAPGTGPSLRVEELEKKVAELETMLSEMKRRRTRNKSPEG